MVSGFPDYQFRAFTSAENFEQLNISASDVEATSSFAKSMKSLLIYNDGPNAVHINFGAIATTDKFKLPSKSYFVVDLIVIDIHTKCADGETATLYAVGTY